ncbi:hypothetical protein [Nocardia sp. JMUB6875]|uniref:hypothetical protein n=1 Tax=Nocardia sp. JMUB6875 TaxID=3158170 RepID=UPI0034E8C78A
MTNSTIITTADELADAWTRLWNGAFEIAEELIADDFRVIFGEATEANAHPADAVTTAGQFADYLRKFHAEYPDVRFEMGAPTTGSVTASGISRVGLVWHMWLPDGTARSGIDVLEAVDARIARVWSVTGRRRLPTD